MKSDSPTDLGLPHRPPFLWLDRVQEHDPGKRVVATRFFGPEEPFFGGHFPGEPLVPGVILCECMAQAAGIAANSPDRPPVAWRLTAIRQAKFHAPVFPDSTVEIEATAGNQLGALVQCHGRVVCEGTLVAEATLVLSRHEKAG